MITYTEIYPKAIHQSGKYPAAWFYLPKSRLLEMGWSTDEISSLPIVNDELSLIPFLEKMGLQSYSNSMNRPTGFSVYRKDGAPSWTTKYNRRYTGTYKTPFEALVALRFVEKYGKTTKEYGFKSPVSPSAFIFCLNDKNNSERPRTSSKTTSVVRKRLSRLFKSR